MTGRRNALGAHGETVAARWYEARGYRLVDRNWRCRDGELDLVLSKGRTLVFCEVKTRSSMAYGSPAEAVTATKQARIRKLAVQWLHDTGTRGAALRFDVAGVIGDQVDVIEAAF